MDSRTLFSKAIEEVAPCIERVTADQLGNVTPCSEWDLRALLNHIVYELLWVPDLLMGKTVAEVGSKYDGDVLGNDPVGSWQKASSAATKAVSAADPDKIVHLSYTDVPAKNYIIEMVGDVLIHGWDVGQAIGCSIVFEDDVAKVLYDATLPRKDEFVASGFFAKSPDVPEDASMEVKLLAVFGRTPNWQTQSKSHLKAM